MTSYAGVRNKRSVQDSTRFLTWKKCVQTRNGWKVPCDYQHSVSLCRYCKYLSLETPFDLVFANISITPSSVPKSTLGGSVRLGKANRWAYQWAEEVSDMGRGPVPLWRDTKPTAASGHVGMLPLRYIILYKRARYLYISISLLLQLGISLCWYTGPVPGKQRTPC